MHRDNGSVSYVHRSHGSVAGPWPCIDGSDPHMHECKAEDLTLARHHRVQQSTISECRVQLGEAWAVASTMYICCHAWACRFVWVGAKLSVGKCLYTEYIWTWWYNKKHFSDCVNLKYAYSGIWQEGIYYVEHTLRFQWTYDLYSRDEALQQKINWISSTSIPQKITKKESRILKTKVRKPTRLFPNFTWYAASNKNNKPSDQNCGALGVLCGKKTNLVHRTSPSRGSYINQNNVPHGFFSAR